MVRRSDFWDGSRHTIVRAVGFGSGGTCDGESEGRCEQREELHGAVEVGAALGLLSARVVVRWMSGVDC